MLLGLTALTWVILIPATMCWPVAGFIVYLVWRSSQHHEEAAEAERKRLLDAAAAQTASGPGGPAS
jgi:hypothetical protein